MREMMKEGHLHTDRRLLSILVLWFNLFQLKFSMALEVILSKESKISSIRYFINCTYISSHDKISIKFHVHICVVSHRHDQQNQILKTAVTTQ